MQHGATRSVLGIIKNTLGFIEEGAKGGKPFFVGSAPIAPHVEYLGSGGFLVPQPAPRHAGLYPNATIPRGYNFNPDQVCFNPVERYLTLTLF